MKKKGGKPPLWETERWPANPHNTSSKDGIPSLEASFFSSLLVQRLHTPVRKCVVCVFPLCYIPDAYLQLMFGDLGARQWGGGRRGRIAAFLLLTYRFHPDLWLAEEGATYLKGSQANCCFKCFPFFSLSSPPLLGASQFACRRWLM